MTITPNLIYSVLAATVFSSIVGALWYSDLLFGKVWKRAMNLSEERYAHMKTPDGKAKGMRAMMFNFLTTIVTMIGLAYLFVPFSIWMYEDKPLEVGLKLGLYAWFFFVTTTVLQSVFFEDKPWKLAHINLSYRLVELVGAGAIISFLM